MAQITKNEEQAVISIMTAVTQMPLESKMYVLGLAQGLANINLVSKSDGRK